MKLNRFQQAWVFLSRLVWCTRSTENFWERVSHLHCFLWHRAPNIVEAQKKVVRGKEGEGLPQWLSSKESTCIAGDIDLIPGSGRSLGGGHGNPLRYSCLEDPRDRGAWRATVHGVTKSRTRLKWLSTHTCRQGERKEGKEAGRVHLGLY